MRSTTEKQWRDPKWWNENAGTASYYCPVNGQFYDSKLHPCCIPRPTQWKGPQDGLPPVGATHEDADLFGLGYSKPEYEVVAHHYNGVTAIVSVKTEDGIQYRPAKAPHFRPIQSERDKAVSEMMSYNSLSPYEFVESLYDAGYRKQVSRTSAIDTISAYMALNKDKPRSELAAMIADALGYKD